MAELYIFSQDDSFITILTEEEGLVDTWFKDYQNHIPDESFIFNVDSNSELLQHIKEENQIAFYDRDNDLRLMRMKELYEVSTKDGHNIRVKCEPSFLELYDHFIEDKRYVEKAAQNALNGALQGSRYVGEVTVELGLATDNFYWIDGIEAVFKIISTWGGALKDTITLDEDNEITERKLWIVQRLGTDNGLIVEPDYNAEQISRKTLSYVETALWGQGASLAIEDDDGDLTGGHTRYITFEDVEWKVSNGDPIDKPKGQKWVGDPDALAEHGYLHNGTRKHRFGHFSNQDETPEELLMATWQELQERKLKEIIHEATIYELDKKVSLGDTVTILNRKYNKPIELQSQITGLEYDILDIAEVTIIVGKYIDMSENPLQKDVDDLKQEVSKPRPTKPIDNNSFPDVKPGTPINVNATGAFQTIQLFWDYDSNVYISHYEVYGSQVSDFIPDEQHLLYRGRVSSFSHEVETDEMWYYYVRAVNTRGTVGEFSNRVSASSVRVISDDILFGSILAEHLQDNLDLANKLSDGTLDWINDEPLYQINEMNTRLLGQIDNKVDYIDYQNAMIDVNADLNNINLSVIDVQGDVNNAKAQITAIDASVGNLSLSVSEVQTDLNNLEIGGRNLVLNSEHRNFQYVTDFEVSDVETAGQDLVVSFSFVSNIPVTIKVGLFWSDGSGAGSTFTYNTPHQKVRHVFKFENAQDLQKIQFEELTGNPTQNNQLHNVQLEIGNKATAWRPAPEEMADKAGLISYINLSTEGVRIHGEKVHISGQTIIDDAVIGTAAIANLAVDRFHLKYGIIENVHIEDATIEWAKIKSINADSIIVGDLKGIDIYGAKFRSSAGTDYMEIVGGEIELSLNNGRKLDISPTGFYGYNQGGSIRFQADASLVTSAAFGTSNVNVYLASSAAGEARVVDYNTLPAGGNINDYSYNPIRSLIYRFPDIPNGYFTLYNGGEFRFTGESITSPVYQAVRAAGYYGNYLDARGTVDHLYVRPRTSAGELRVTRSGTTDDYLDVRARNFAGVRVGLGTHFSNSTHFYVTTSAGGEVRFVSRSDDAAYRPIRISDLITHSGQIYTSDSSITLRANGSDRYIFLQMEHSLRVTGPGQASNFKEVHAKDFVPSSSEKWKTNIKKYEDSALDLLRNSVIYQYYKHEGADLEFGFITERETPNEIKRGDGISSYSLQSLTVRSVQELDLKLTNNIVSIEDRLNEKDLQIQYLRQKIKQLEAKVA